MSIELNKDTWVWAIVEDNEKNAKFLGQHDTTNNIRFIPSFLEKEAALMCMNQFNKDETLNFEPQAIFYDELLSYAAENCFLIYIINKKGDIIDKIAP